MSHLKPKWLKVPKKRSFAGEMSHLKPKRLKLLKTTFFDSLANLKLKTAKSALKHIKHDFLGEMSLLEPKRLKTNMEEKCPKDQKSHFLVK